ncbi:hypothetical protein DVH05_014249 [Phytophthora capsici]|nr:hypothetical protein DVH05_014249 [Phytophthora capsici]
MERAFKFVQIVAANVAVGGKWIVTSKGDISVCNCKINEDTKYGCGSDCINRAMRYECALECCPCGKRCSNRQLQVRSALVAAVIDCGRKGLGVITLEDVKAGQFVGEYVGEVLSSREAMMRCQNYQKMKHVYMLQVSADEVIDATQIGGCMRFVNHSCDPNFQMEKWNVRGQERCGLFAIHDVKCGDNLTFDYRLHCVDFGVRNIRIERV